VKGTVELWHSLLNPNKDPEKWFYSLLEDGIKPSGGEYLRDKCVYFHKPDEAVYDSEILDKPAVKVEIPENMVYGSNLSNCAADNEFKPNLWEEKITPYSEFKPEGAAEYVVIGPVQPCYIDSFHPEGPNYEAVKNHEGWQNLDLENSKIETAAELFI